VAKKYIVALTAEERSELEKLTRTGKTAAYKINHARVLLKADRNQAGGEWKDREISEALNISIATIERIRERAVLEGITVAVNRKEQIRRRARIIDGEQEAHLIAIACSQAPIGKSNWTLQMLADKMVELNYVEQVSTETVRQALKKTSSSRGGMNHG
jgi:transposase